MATFYYETETKWTGEKAGEIGAAGLPPILTGAPPEFNGTPGKWSPEHLFVASLNTCFMLTLLVVAENSKVSLLSLASVARGKLEKAPGAGYQITEIVLKPRVVLERAADLDRISRLLEKAKQNCFISNSIKSAITIQPEIYHGQTQTVPCPPAGSPEGKRG
jgi:organic hydroperoxide reductase OsmC/OhrA